MHNKIVIAVCLLLLGACQQHDPQTPGLAATGVTIMTFNVQNLFDTSDDPGKDDKAYLPIRAKQSAEHIADCNTIEVAGWRDECLHLDWNETVLTRKLEALATAIRQLDGGPDIIVFQEVEKAALLDRLSREFLADFGYGPAILIEGQDLRGIDVGFLSRLPLAGPPSLHAQQFPGFAERQGDTRGILEATFVLPDGAKLTGFAVHFPAPFHPLAMREIAYRQLAELRQALPDEHYAFAAGDFNTVSTEAAASGIFERLVRPTWTIAHDDCRGDCRGTYYYARDDNWSFLDLILWSPSRGKNTTWRIRADSVRVLNASDNQLTANRTPAKFSATDRRGVSDHWPLAMTIEPIEKQ